MSHNTFNPAAAWNSVSDCMHDLDPDGIATAQRDFDEGYLFAAHNTRPGAGLAAEVALLSASFHREATMPPSVSRMLGMVAAVEALRQGDNL